MAIAVPQGAPIAQVPVVLGLVRRLAGATVRDRLLPPPPRRRGSRVGVGAQPWSSRGGLGLMPSLRWGNGWQHGAG